MIIFKAQLIIFKAQKTCSHFLEIILKRKWSMITSLANVRFNGKRTRTMNLRLTFVDIMRAGLQCPCTLLMAVKMSYLIA